MDGGHAADLAQAHLGQVQVEAVKRAEPANMKPQQHLAEEAGDAGASAQPSDPADPLAADRAVDQRHAPELAEDLGRGGFQRLQRSRRHVLQLGRAEGFRVAVHPAHENAGKVEEVARDLDSQEPPPPQPVAAIAPDAPPDR